MRHAVIFSCLAVILAPLSMPEILSAQSPVEVARAYRQENGSKILRDFSELLSIPNVARDSANILRNAQYIRDQLTARGVTSELLFVDGAPPIVYGELLVPGAERTLGIYVHYDGQPVDPTMWSNAPWEPTLYTQALENGGQVIPMPADGDSIDPEWRIYARSAGDDKAPLGALFAVLDAFNERGIQPTSNLKFFLDGEEEAGSRHLREYLEGNRAKLDDIDVWLFFDGPVHQSRRPMVTFGVRGVTGLEVTVYGANRPLHSGHYGNWAPVPGQMLATLLAGMKDADGNVLIDGFYDTVEPLSEEEREILANMPDYDEELKQELGLAWTEGGGQTLPERLLLPSLTVRGLSSANVGALARNVVPATATAALGVRLVKGNDPEAMLDLVEAHIRNQGYHIVREDPDEATRLQYPRIAKVTRRSGYPAARTSVELPIVRQIIGAAHEAAGEELLLVPALGGSLPLYLFTQVMERPALITPIANHDDNQHAANENLRIANLWYGIDLYAALLTMGDAIP